MDNPIRPLDALSINEICEMAKQAAYRGDPLDQVNVFKGHARNAFEAAYHQHAEAIA